MRNSSKFILFGLILMVFTGGAMAATTLTGGVVSPGTGTIGTAFDFTVTYTDTDNISASYVNVTVNTIPHSMNEVDPADVNLTDGKTYTITGLSGFAVGTHNYAFYTDNGNGTVGPADASTFTTTNSAPVLSSMGVSPGSGSPATNFDFLATYTDADNDSAAYMNVTIDGVAYAMSETDAGDINVADGKAYTYSNSGYTTGTHAYNFSSSDGTATVGPTGDGTFSINTDSSIAGSISPGSGTPTDTFYFNATFTDADNDTATYVKVAVNGTEHTMVEVDPTDVTTTDGKAYTYNITGFPIGSHTYTFKASDGTSTPEDGSYSFNVDVSNHPPTLSGASVTTADKFIVGELIHFTVTYTDSDNNASTLNYVQIDGVNNTMFKVDGSDVDATNGIDYTYNKTLAQGDHTYTFFASDGTFGVNTTPATRSIFSKTYFSGDRIWDENAGQSTTYEWNAKSFSGFFYDLESGLSSEKMTITGIDRTIDDKDIVYETSPVETDFEHSAWGKYQVIGFMAEKYFAAYTANTSFDDFEIISMMSDGQLAKVLMDDDEKESVFSGSSLILEEGYELKIVEVDVNGNSVFVRLTKDGDEIDSNVVSGGSDYIYQVDIGDSDDVVLIAVHFDNIFSGTESNAVFVKGIFQISDEYTQVENGDSFGKMEVTSVGDTMIQMKNDDSVSLSKGKIVDIMGKIKLIVADDDDLRFAPFVDMSEPGTYELRGTVAEGAELLTWNPLNFEGFYYDIDEGIQTEQLQVVSISTRTISDDQLVYTSTPKEVEFEHSAWNNFTVIGFRAEKYFAGYPSTAFSSGKTVDMLSDGQLSKVIMDDDEKVSVFSGRDLVLGEGYVLRIVEVDRDGNQVWVKLYNDGDEVDDGIISANDDYIYETDLGESDDVPLIAVHFNEVFRGSESNAVFVQGIFQISEDYLELESGDTFGKMRITSLGGSIVMKNEDSISLSKDKDIEIMENIGIKVADSDTVRYYPYTEVKTAPDDELKVEFEKSVVKKGEEITITITSRGASIEGATVKVEDVKIGTTDDEGRIDYTFTKIGNLDVLAEKEGYVSGTDTLEVIDPDDETKKMSIEVSPEEVFEGSSMTIFVLKSIGGDAIQGAEVTFDGKSLGSTSADGTITYTPTEPGMHKLVAIKSGLLDAELNIKVEELAAKFEFSNFVIDPLDVKQGKKATFNVDVENTGTAAGDYTVELKVNGTVVGSQTISMEVGASQNLEFEHAEEEPGTYVVKIGDLETTYEVFEKSSTVLYVLGAIVLAAAGGLGYLFTAGGWTVEIAQAKVGEAIEAIKELVANYR